MFGTELVKRAELDPSIVAITAAMPSGTGLDLFAKRFPDRCFDVGIAEQHAVTFAAGLDADGITLNALHALGVDNISAAGRRA